MPYGTVNADVIQSSVANTSLGAGNASIMKNRIINGAMVIDQRNAGASVTVGTDQYTLDRWYAQGSVTSKYSVQQTTTAPTGFNNSLKVTSLSAYSVGASETFQIGQKIEGFNWADIGYGTASAKTTTLSFWVQSSLTGTFGGVFINSAGNRSYPFTYTISAANTWEQKSITIAGDTTGTWVGATNGIGLNVMFSLGAGSTYSGTAGSWAATTYLSATGATSVVGTNGATFYITGVQLEVGSSATGYEYRQYTAELQLCQRYYSQAIRGNYPGSFAMTAFSTNGASCSLQFPVTMRATPTFTIYYIGTANQMGNINTAGAVSTPSSQTWWSQNGVIGFQPSGNPFTAGLGYGFDYTASAEL